MKILSVEQIRQGDRYTIEHEPVADIDLMERAASACHRWIKSILKKNSRILVFCGTGNNGGDGFAIARMLLKDHFQVEAFFVKYSDKISESCMKNIERLKDNSKAGFYEIGMEDTLPLIGKDDVVIDALFGSGLHQPVSSFPANVIQHINESGAKVIAVDVPSGLFCDKTVKGTGGKVIQADYTLTFEFPKLAFLLPENDIYVGEWLIMNINIHPDFIETVETKNYLITGELVKSIIKPRVKFTHKGIYGHALLIAGSYGKTGASVLSSEACLRSGAGLLTVHIPRSSYTILQTAVPEAMTDPDEDEYCVTSVRDVTSYSAVGIGPGIGMDKRTQSVFKLLIQNSAGPFVIDADAINILGENKTWIPFLPQNSILTPHPREFERIAGKTANDFERLEIQREFSKRFGLYVVLKGAHTAITFPDGKCFFNTTGNPGMATAGSGDVLTGILLGLKAQGYMSAEAVLLGVYLHGLAGDIAANNYSMEAMIAGDIVRFIGKAYRKLSGR